MWIKQSYNTEGRNTMAVAVRQGVEGYCDHCGSIQFVAELTKLQGFAGTTIYRGADDSIKDLNWFACLDTCISGAILSVLARHNKDYGQTEDYATRQIT